MKVRIWISRRCFSFSTRHWHSVARPACDYSSRGTQGSIVRLCASSRPQPHADCKSVKVEGPFKRRHDIELQGSVETVVATHQASCVVLCRRVLRWTVGWFRRCCGMHDSFLRGDLPPATLPSCFCTDATGGYPGGVWYSSLPLRDRAASDRGPGHSTDTYGVVAARRAPM